MCSLFLQTCKLFSLTRLFTSFAGCFWLLLPSSSHYFHLGALLTHFMRLYFRFCNCAQLMRRVQLFAADLLACLVLGGALCACASCLDAAIDVSSSCRSGSGIRAATLAEQMLSLVRRRPKWGANSFDSHSLTRSLALLFLLLLLLLCFLLVSRSLSSCLFSLMLRSSSSSSSFLVAQVPPPPLLLLLQAASSLSA